MPKVNADDYDDNLLGITIQEEIELDRFFDTENYTEYWEKYEYPEYMIELF